MNKKLPLLKFFLSSVFLFICLQGHSQITYSEGFEGTTTAWDISNDFFAVDTLACSGNTIIVGESYSFFGFNAPASTQAAIGMSNGQPATLTYSYKLLDYYTLDAIPNDPDWGTVTVSYATSPAGPWTAIQTITPSGHIPSASCATKTATFTPTGGAMVYLQFLVEANENEDLDFYLFVDDIAVTQSASPACTGTPAASVTVAANASICNSQSAVLSLSPVYLASGLNYQWQSSADGVTYTNVTAGGTSATFTATQAASTWYRATITCGSGGSAVTSTPVHVINTGLPCLCDVPFDEDVEPITLVNFAGINNTSSAVVNGTPAVQDFSALAPGQVVAGQSYPITLQGNTNGNYETFFTVYIDFNHNGDFTDAGESFEAGSVDNSSGTDGIQAVTTIAIPANATPGITYMRVIKLYDSYADDPCSSEAGSGFGQVEDYLLNVTSSIVNTLSYVNLQSPATLTINQGSTGTVYAQAYQAGVTEAAGAATGLTAWIGISTTNTNPNTWTTWIPATFNVQSGNNDEFMAAIGTGLTPGTYYYASRFQLNGGAYYYGGYTASGGGLWSATNISGVLTVNCATPAPVFTGEFAYCAGTTAASLPADTVYVWYFGPTGNNAIPSGTVLTTGTYYAAQIQNGCESITRTAVLITINSAVADAPADVTACNSYRLPALTSGNYFTATGGAGTAHSAGDVITESTTLYVYATTATVPSCTDEHSFDITITTVADITGEHNQTINAAPADATIEDIVIGTTATATVTWYSDAALTTPVAAGTQITAGSTYYAVQTVGLCNSPAFPVTIDAIMGVNTPDANSFKAYPNPVTDVLTVTNSLSISAVEVYNLLGQKVLGKQGINATEAQLDLSALSGGTYMVKVTSGSLVKTLKVVKQ